MADLDNLVRSLTRDGGGPFAFAGIATSDDRQNRFYTSTASGIVADENSYFRVASISKIVTGRVAERTL